MAPPKPSRHVCCTLCGAVLAGWLPIFNRPEASMLLYHLGANHLAEAKPYLTRMETECIDTVVMELFVRVAHASPSGDLPCA